MAGRSGDAEEPELPDLLKGIVEDAEALIGQQFDLLRAEVREEVGRLGGAAATVGTGAVLMATGGMLGVLMSVHALRKATGMPLWACYGVVGGLLGGAGVALVATGRRQAAGIEIVPTETVAALRENLTWLKDQAIPPTT